MKGNRITFIYFIFGTLSVILVGFILYSSLTGVLINESVMSTENSVNQSGKYLEVYIDKLKIISNTIVSNPDVIDFFSHEGDLDSSFYMKRINGLIDDQMRATDSLESIIIISKDGKLFSNEDNLDMTMSEDMMKEDWYVKAIHNEMPSLTSARMQKFSMDKDLWVISLSQEIVDYRGNNIGVAVIDVPYTAFEAYLMDLHLGEGGFAFILNNSDGVVFHADVSYYEDPEKVNELVAVKSMPIGYQTGSDTLISKYSMANTDWTLIAVCSVDALTILRRQILETILFGIGIILLVVIITSIILRRLTSEIKEREGEIHHYEMNALYSQINPHFLYNTLDTIVWMAEFNQKEEVIETTKSLAQFFRLSLNKGKELTSLEDEVEHAAKYLYIQKQRYQEKLTYEFKVDESLKDIIIPKIILQPVIENSIYHGIKDKDGQGHIEIKAYGDGRDIKILVADNGVGFNMEDSHLPKSTKTKLGGVGLMNVDKRIKLYCGENYGIGIKSKVGAGTTVTLTLCIKGEHHE